MLALVKQKQINVSGGEMEVTPLAVEKLKEVIDQEGDAGSSRDAGRAGHRLRV